MLLRLQGGAATATARKVKLRLVTKDGALAMPYGFPEGDGALTLPGTVLVKVGDNVGALGVFLWAENASGQPVAHVRSQACYRINSGAQNTFDLELQPVPAAFVPNAAEACRCNGSEDMCARGGSVGGMGGSGSGGGFSTGGAHATMGGSGGGGAGGINVAVDGGSGDDAAPVMGGRTVDAAGMPDAAPVVSNGLFSFDNAGDWSSQEAAVTLDMVVKSQGAASIKFTAGAAAYVRSRPFATNELTGATNKLALDVHVSVPPAAGHNIQLWFQCERASVYNAYVQYKALHGLSAGWHQLIFDLPAPVVQALRGQHEGCLLWMQHEAPGTYHYDNMGFVP